MLNKLAKHRKGVTWGQLALAVIALAVLVIVIWIFATHSSTVSDSLNCECRTVGGEACPDGMRLGIRSCTMPGTETRGKCCESFGG